MKKILLLILILQLPHAFAAKVIGLKKRNIVVINEGTESGFERKRKVCFFNKKDRKVACGRIVSSRKTKSYAQVKRRFSRIRKGHWARILGTESLHAAGPKHFWEISGHYTAQLSTNSVFNIPNYVPPEAGATEVDTLWTSSSTNNSAMASFGAEIDALPYKLGAGFMYSTRGPLANYTDYDSENASLYLHNTVNYSALSLYATYWFGSFFGSFYAGVRGEFESSTLTFSAFYKDDTGETEDMEIYSLSSQLNLISIAFPLKFSMMVNKSFGIKTEFIPSLPLFGMGPTSTAVAEDPANGEKALDPQADLIQAIGHGKGGFGLAIKLAAFLAI